jgi:hypothetical protein
VRGRRRRDRAGIGEVVVVAADQDEFAIEGLMEETDAVVEGIAEAELHQHHEGGERDAGDGGREAEWSRQQLAPGKWNPGRADAMKQVGEGWKHHGRNRTFTKAPESPAAWSESVSSKVTSMTRLSANAAGSGFMSRLGFT